MQADSSFDVIVLGAGVLGLAIAAELGASGRTVGVIDPGAVNASSVAAGMIAPALEAVLEDCDPGRAALLRRAAALWPHFAERFNVTLHREGSDWLGPDPSNRLARIQDLGFEGCIDGEAVHVCGEARVEPLAALAALRAAAGVEMVEGEALALARDGDGWSVRLGDGRGRAGRHLVVATGTGPALPGLPRPVMALIARIQPIRGQLLEIEGRLPRVQRSGEGYAAPGRPGRILIGATMEAGRRDLTPDPETEAYQRRLGERLIGAPLGESVARVGVRGASPDGLPLAGPVGDGLSLALGPRRNGWLLAPLVARMIVDGVEGRPVPEPALAASRFF